MRITYLLPEPELNGGNKVVAHHACLLAAAGCAVTVVAYGPRPAWFPSAPRYLDLGAGPLTLPRQDLVIATFWTTLAVAERLALGPVAHYCQGYEGDLDHLAPQRAAIAAAYRQAGPAFAVSPTLAERIAGEFGRPVRVVPPALDPAFRPRLRWRPRRRPWVLVPGIFEAPVKGVPTALAAVAELGRRGFAVRLIRLSILPLSAAERTLVAPEVYLCEVAPAEAARWLCACDLLLLPSMPGEGFGLPLLEAMGGGVPAVASRLPAIEWMAAGAASLVEPGDAVGFAQAAETLLADSRAWRLARGAGRRAAARFSPAVVGAELLDAVRWAVAQSK